MREILTTIPDYEDKRTIELLRQFKSLGKQDFLTKAQLLEILTWKSPRPLKRYLANSEKDVKEITALAFSTKDDKMKAHILTALTGVNLPAASAILMFYNPTKFPVIDIRVWQQLHKAKLVDTNPKGQGFKLQEWEKYLTVIRSLAKELKLTARQVEKRLFDLDKNTRKGKLYTQPTKK
jgi:thermostable 8-oxoguanine DNA glycosylase